MDFRQLTRFILVDDADIDFVFKSSADPEVSEQLYQGIKAIGKHQSIVKAGNAAATAVQDMPFWQIAGDEEQSYLPRVRFPKRKNSPQCEKQP